MIGSSVESRSITLVPGGTSPELAGELQAQMEALLPRRARKAFYTAYEPVFHLFHRAEVFLDEPAAPMAKILSVLGMTEPETCVYVNYQPPKSRQRFHKDNRRVDGETAVVHCADGGAFEYSFTAVNEEQAALNRERIKLSAGDILFHDGKDYFHRGRNLSRSPRATVAVYKITKP